jgi:hypothetical protein
MDKLEKMNELLQQIQTDIRLEVILAELIEDGLGQDEFTVVSSSLFKRNYHRDIEKTEETIYGPAKKKRLSFIVNREGIYDLLPQDLFHQPSDFTDSSNTERIIQEIQIQNELERAGRLFFMPIEQEYYLQRVKLETEERTYLFETNSDLPGEIFDDLWDFPDFLDLIQKSKLGVLMPVLNKIVGDIRLTSLIFNMITGDEITIVESPPLRKNILIEPELGKMNLGIDSILAGEVCSTISSLTLQITVQPENLSDYLPGGKKIKIHEFLCNLLLPFEKIVLIDLDLSKSPIPFIAENETSFMGRLNFTTAI